jgi:6-pyruvoyltetrahydropterin/6-carboxytetrahydropterin synthase
MPLRTTAEDDGLRVVLKMYRVATEQVFRASHALVLGGEREALHEHDWLVRVTVERAELDEDGLVIDFRLLEKCLSQAVAGFVGADIGELAEIMGMNASAEVVARVIYDKVALALPSEVRLGRVEVQEAAGCWAGYFERYRG